MLRSKWTAELLPSNTRSNNSKRPALPFRIIATCVAREQFCWSTHLLLHLETQPFWKCSGLGKQRNADDIHVFNMRDFDQLQEMFDIILELLDKEDSNGDPVFDCVSHNHVPCRSGWPEADKTAALLLEAYVHTCTSFTHFTTAALIFGSLGWLLTCTLTQHTVMYRVVGSIQSADAQSGSYAVVPTLAVLCLLCWLVRELHAVTCAECLFVLSTTVTPVWMNNRARCWYWGGLASQTTLWTEGLRYFFRFLGNLTDNADSLLRRSAFRWQFLQQGT